VSIDGFHNTKSSGFCLLSDNSTLAPAIKSSTQMYLDNAWDKWHDLQLEGWSFVELELPESV